MKQKHALPLTFFLVLILYNFATGFAHPVTPTLIIERNLPSQWYGYAGSAVSIGTFMIAPFWGKLCNYKSTKSLIILGNLGYIFGQVIMCTAMSGPQLLIGRVTAGTLSCAATIGNLNYIMNVGDEENRARYLTIYATSGSVCNALGFFVGGWLGILGVEAAFIGQGIVCVLAAALAFLWLEDDTPYKMLPENHLRFREVNPFAAFADTREFMTKSLLFFFVAMTMIGIGMSCFENSFNFYIRDYFKLGSQYNGTIKAVIAAGGLLINSTIAMWLIRHTNVHRTLFYSTAAIAVFAVGAVTACRSMLLLSGFFICYSLANFIYLSISQNLIARHSTRSTSNSLMGFYQGMRSLGSVIGSFLQANIYAMSSLYSFIFAAGTILIGVVISFFYSVLQSRETQRA